MMKFWKNIFLILSTILLVSASVKLFSNNDIVENNIINDEIDFSNMTMNCLGDSITWGYDTDNNGNQMKNPYPKLLKEELGLAKVRNYGISGSTLTSVYTNKNPMSLRYKKMMSNADIISVMGGINDYWMSDVELGQNTDTDTTTIYGALNVLTKGLKIKYPNSYIFFMTPYKWGNDMGSNSLGYSLEDISNAIKEVCSYHNIDVLDMYENGNIEIDFEKESSDLLHPSQEFIQEYTTPQIANYIREHYKKA